MGQGNKALKAWVARDYDGSLYMYSGQPKKMSDFWHAQGVGYMKLDDSLFSKVKWEDEEPKYIELSIRDEKSKIKSALSFLCRIALFVFILCCTVVGILHVIQWIIWQIFRT